MSRSVRTEALVLALLDGPWASPGIWMRVTAALEAPAEARLELVRALRRRFRARPDERSLREALAEREGTLAEPVHAVVSHRARPLVRRFHLPPLAGLERASFAPGLPAIETPDEAGRLVGLDPRDAAFFVGAHLDGGRAPLAPALDHYRYRWIAKASGGLRLIEAPKARLSAMQRRLLDRVLAHVPVHPAAHAFVRGRSARTFARAHAGARIVVRLDLEDFFASVGAGRVRALFVALGYSRAVADVFTRLATHRTPSALLRERPAAGEDLLRVAARARETRRFARRHLPQGAPSSPLLASLAAHGLDVRLSALARSFEATYARYADDLAFSGDAQLARNVGALLGAATSIANDEGFAVRFDKTRVMRAGGRQELAGLVVNAWPDVSRERYDALRARLHRVASGRDLPATRREREVLHAELAGHVSWASDRPHRARKLAALLDRATALLASPEAGD